MKKEVCGQIMFAEFLGLNKILKEKDFILELRFFIEGEDQSFFTKPCNLTEIIAIEDELKKIFYVDDFDALKGKILMVNLKKYGSKADSTITIIPDEYMEIELKSY